MRAGPAVPTLAAGTVQRSAAYERCRRIKRSCRPPRRSVPWRAPAGGPDSGGSPLRSADRPPVRLGGSTDPSVWYGGGSSAGGSYLPRPHDCLLTCSSRRLTLTPPRQSGSLNCIPPSCQTLPEASGRRMGSRRSGGYICDCIRGGSDRRTPHR